MKLNPTAQKALNFLFAAGIVCLIGGRFYYVVTHTESAAEENKTALHSKELLDDIYADVLIKNREAVDEEWDYVKDANEAVGTQYASFSSSEEVGYSYIDLDDDGMEELIIMPLEGTPSNKGQILALYDITGDDRTPSLVLHSDTLTPAYLSQNNYIIWYNNQPAETICSYYLLNDNSPQSLEFIEAWIQDKSSGSAKYYQTMTDPSYKEARTQIDEASKTALVARYAQVKDAQYCLADTVSLENN